MLKTSSHLVLTQRRLLFSVTSNISKNFIQTSSKSKSTSTSTKSKEFSASTNQTTLVNSLSLPFRLPHVSATLSLIYMERELIYPALFQQLSTRTLILE
jgi:hypothetical protein